MTYIVYKIKIFNFDYQNGSGYNLQIYNIIAIYYEKLINLLSAVVILLQFFGF